MAHGSWLSIIRMALSRRLQIAAALDGATSPQRLGEGLPRAVWCNICFATLICCDMTAAVRQKARLPIWVDAVEKGLVKTGEQ
jgi:hypothetical protein